MVYLHYYDRSSSLSSWSLLSVHYIKKSKQNIYSVLIGLLYFAKHFAWKVHKMFCEIFHEVRYIKNERKGPF